MTRWWQRFKAWIVAGCLLIPALMALFKLARPHAPYLEPGYLLLAGLYLAVAALYLTPLRRRLSGRLWFGFGITTVCLLLLVDWIEPGAAWRALRTAHYGLLLLMLVPYLLSFWLRAVRWQFLLAPVKPVTFRNSFDAMMIGFWGNNLYPARAGEFLRAYAIARTEAISKSAAFATVVMERIWDGMTILLFLVLLVMFYPFESADVRWGGALGLVVYGGALVLMLLVHFFEPQARGLLARTLGERCPPARKARFDEILCSFSRGIAVVRSGKQLAWIAGSSLLIWLLNVAAIYPVLLAFDFGVPFDRTGLLVAATLILVLTALAITIPSAPGGAGPFHLAGMLALQAVAPPLAPAALATYKSVSGSFAVVFWILSVLPTVLIGFWCLWSARINLRDLRGA